MIPVFATDAVPGETFRRTRRTELDLIMPVRTSAQLERTPFQGATPMPLRVGVLRSQHYSLAEIAEILYVSYESAKKYFTRFCAEMQMSPAQALRTVSEFEPLLLAGWAPEFRVHGGPMTPDAA
jgi:hypothetical protein